MENQFYVYALYSDAEMLSTFYIGKGKGNRAYSHARLKTKERNRIKNAACVRTIEALGHLPIKILHAGLTEGEAFSLEVALIAQHGRICDGSGVLANLTIGGDGAAGFKPSDEVRARMSESAKTRKREPRSDDVRKRISEALKGKQRSLAHCKALSDAKSGSSMSEEGRAKLSASRMGRTFSAETRAKLRASNVGQKRSQEAREKMRQSGRVKVFTEAHRESLRIASQARWARLRDSAQGVHVNG